MASVFANMYVKMIKIGKRTIDDVRPDELKEEVIDLLVAEGLFDLAGVDGPKVENEAEEIEPAPVEEEPIEEAPDEGVEDEEPHPAEDEPTESEGE